MTFWTDERKAEVKRLYEEGWSASQIARETGAPSRSAVCSILFRMNVTREKPAVRTHAVRPSPVRRAKRRTIHAGNIVARLATRAEETPRPLPIAPPAPVTSRNVPLLDLKADDCRFMEGDPRAPGAGFCGHPRRFGSPYCAWHHSRCYHAVTDRRADLAGSEQAEAA